MNKKQDKLLSIILLFIILQPIFDIFSFLSIREIIPFNISTYLKPLIVFSLGIYSLFNKNNQKRRNVWIIYISVFMMFIIGHFYILSKLLIDINTILHEFRFIINIAYMVAIYIIMYNIYNNYSDKEELLRKLKKTILITFSLYFFLLLLSILSGTSALTYEYSDSSKHGYKGWFDSGQILGHAFSIMFPLLMYTILTPKRIWYERIIIILLFIIGVSLIGTKVPYYITIIVLILYLIISIFIKIFNKEHRTNYFNIIFIAIMILLMIGTYQYTPVKYNTDINNQVSSIDASEYDFENESGSNEALTEEELRQMYPDKDIKRLVEYHKWNKQASDYLTSQFESEKIHPSNMRYKQVSYANKKFSLSSIEYKIFGLGFLNQDSSLALESDFFMSLYSFGILGFLLFLTIPLYEFIKSTIYILKHLKVTDLETYMIYMGLGVFFCISIYAGYTYIYTNFSIFLVLLITMLKIKLDLLKKNQINNNKISFLLLHLGYGGIETATINTANNLCDDYEVELISFYKLEKNQESRINKKIKIKYLYNGEPNRDEFKNSLKSHELFNTLKEGFKAINILVKKRILIIKEIINSNSKFLVSTRWDFSILLSKYGHNQNIKIACEHHYHNNNKKYINVLKNKYYNIDYLFALTKTLEEDYKKFLKNNHHTKIILMPNMLDNIPVNKTNISSKNIITMSRLDPGKRNDEIIKIFSKIENKDWNLYILGDGAEYDNLIKLVKELNLEKRVFLPGYITKEKLPDYLTNSSIFLMASITEGLPMVLLEAMSYGIPCIAYEIPSGVSDIIDDNKNGYIIKNRNQEEYINKLNILIKDNNLRENMSSNAILKANDYSCEKIIKKWNEILKGCINNEK